MGKRSPNAIQLRLFRRERYAKQAPDSLKRGETQGEEYFLVPRRFVMFGVYGGVVGEGGVYCNDRKHAE